MQMLVVFCYFLGPITGEMWVQTDSREMREQRFARRLCSLHSQASKARRDQTQFVRHSYLSILGTAGKANVTMSRVL